MHHLLHDPTLDQRLMPVTAAALRAEGHLRKGVRGAVHGVVTIFVVGVFLLLPRFPAAAQAAPDGCQELVVNGGFEAATIDPWQESSAAGFPLLDGFFVHSGSQSAWLGGYTSASDYLTQTLTLPAGATLATLQMWMQIETTEANNAAALDIFTVEIKDAAGSLLGAVATLSNQDHSAAWVVHSYDLRAHAGQTVQLVLHGAGSEDSNVTDFHVDDVSLAVCSSDQKVYLPWLHR